MSEEKKRFFVSMYDVIDRENGRKLQMYEIIDLLNEQQAIIRRDEISIKTMMSNMKKLEEENECLLNKNKLLTAFIVEKGFAEEYIRWRKVIDDE